jgi:acyl-CoA synthetase (AMP-forming)/AMP-acid ligase II
LKIIELFLFLNTVKIGIIGKFFYLAVVAHSFNPRTQEAEVAVTLSKCQDSQGYTEKPSLKKKTKQKQQKISFSQMYQPQLTFLSSS